MKLSEVISDPRFGPRKSDGPIINPKVIAKAVAAGFDTSQIWYHGSEKKIAKFKRGKHDVELGPGIYFADSFETASYWAGSDGKVMSCYLKTGDFFDLRSFNDPSALNDLYKRFTVYMQKLWGANEGETFAEFKSRLSGIIAHGQSRNNFLENCGFVGAYNHESQIIGQIVVFDPANIMIAAISSSDEITKS